MSGEVVDNVVASDHAFTGVRLHGYWRSSSAWRVRIALNVKGIAFEHIGVNIAPGKDEQKSDAFRAKNPLAQVPILAFVGGGLDGRTLTQSLAVIELLDELVPTPALLPSTAWGRAQARMLAEIVNSGTQPLQNLTVQGQIKSLGGDVNAWLLRVIGDGLTALEHAAQQSAGRYLVGDDVSVADCCLVPQLYGARRFNVPLEAYPTLLAVEANCAALPAFAAAHPDVQPDAPKP
ncbi:MAG TPA: maleylacetoacetate isomerase [Myxococcota bacterium]